MPTEEVPKGTQLLVADVNKLSEIWRRISGISGVFDDFTRGRSDLFLALFMRRDTWWLERTDGNGILYMTHIVPGLSAEAHIIYWDKRLRGTEQFTMSCLRFAIEKYDLKKVNLYLPDFAGAAVSYAERLMFKREGRIRRWSISNGRTYDVLVYGLTREEAFDGNGLLAVDGVQHAPVVRLGEEPAGLSAVHGELDGAESSGDASEQTGNRGDGVEHSDEPPADPAVPDVDAGLRGDQ